ncbi:hypothetical protein C1M55_28180 [Rhodococcus qingshengii]|uniref:hypothetical protein n=1 Tax=Rhodococcus TaxID=1827 RepID=UPI000C9FE6A4|nr:hypothetical protein [Rhodococcus qingshengii]AUS34610.1 hypothetical protein C1M55_28180 [Rhodococcus qingshengii]
MFGRKTLLQRSIRRRFAVTLAQGEGEFIGVLVESDADMYVFDDCYLIEREGRSKISGRVYVDRISVAYLQELAGG